MESGEVGSERSRRDVDPHDARALVPVGGAAIGGSTLGTQCPRCARLYEADKRFCPFDAEELVSASTAASEVGDRRGGPGGRPSREAAKICPHCAAHYEADATLCGRDGAELVSVN